MKYWKHRLSNNTEAQFTQTRKKLVRLKLTLQILTGFSLKTSSCSSCFITWLHRAKLRRNLMRSQAVVEPGCLKPAELTRLYNLPYIPLALISLVTFSPYCRPWADMGDSAVAGKCALSKDTNQRQMGKPLGDLLPLVLWRVRIACFAVLKKSPRNIVPLSSNYWKILSPPSIIKQRGLQLRGSLCLLTVLWNPQLILPHTFSQSRQTSPEHQSHFCERQCSCFDFRSVVRVTWGSIGEMHPSMVE